MSGNTVDNTQKSLPKIPGRVHEHLKRIRGEDNKISSVAEANEMLAYLPRASVVCTDNPNAIPMAYIEANDYLHEHEKQVKSKKEAKSSDILQKAANLYKTINKGAKNIGTIFSFAEKIKRSVPIYF